MNHSGKLEPSRYYDAQKWAEESVNCINGMLSFRLTDKQKKEISKVMANWYGDIVADEREDICTELQNEAKKAHGSTERSIYREIVKSLKIRGRE
jgi:polyhydroxyalkanoate synthesis regulator phasin